MEDAIEIVNYKGFQIQIHQDTDPMDPRGDYGNQFGKMVCFHSKYNLGDEKHPFVCPEDLINWLEEQDGKVIALPLYLYDHSGITISTQPFSCPWDSGQVGYIYAERQDILKEFNRKHINKPLRKKVIEMLEGEVKWYDQYLRGEVYGYVIKDADGNHIDSCWGFFGDYNEDPYMLNQCREIIDWEIKKQLEDEKWYWNIMAL